MFRNHVFDDPSAQIKLDSVIAEISADDLLLVKRERNGLLTGAGMLIKFMPSALRHSLEKSILKVRLLNVSRKSRGKYRVSLAFHELDKFESDKLKKQIVALG
ncbi:MAG: hypothetical protein RLZZ227_2003 [Pseudomonadota bacterium]|jgi:hypothetical protein